MFIVGLLSWWYGQGWARRIGLVREKIAATVDYFSIGILLKTLAAPYRQIGAGQVRGSASVKWRAFVDRTVSRIMGLIVRSLIIIIGCFAIVMHSIIGLTVILLWGVVPAIPIVGFILFLSGWVPFL